jgi:hypothetical protein
MVYLFFDAAEGPILTPIESGVSVNWRMESSSTIRRVELYRGLRGVVDPVLIGEEVVKQDAHWPG